jgi:PhzF family phenazine biosynthesis protein
MQLPIYQIDAFTDRVFAGNPAAVCPLSEWLPDATMQAIAAENNLSETAYFCREADGYRIRWFTPTVEVDLCGHATLASGFLLLTRFLPAAASVDFASRSGPLSVTRNGDLFTLDFPASPPEPAAMPDGVTEALGAAPSESLRAGSRIMAVYEEAAHVRALAPEMAAIARLAPGGVIATAPGDDHDFVSRYFVPSHGVAEDPVTGSTHTTLTPFWADRLGKDLLRAAQVSERGGELECTLRGDRVGISGKAVLYMEGKITV